MSLHWGDKSGISLSKEPKHEGIYHGIVRSVKIVDVKGFKVIRIVYKLLNEGRSYTIEEFVSYDGVVDEESTLYKRYTSIVKRGKFLERNNELEVDFDDMVNVPVLVTLSRAEVGDKDSLYISDVVRDAT